MHTEALNWKLQSSSSHGPHSHMTHTAEIDPWRLPAARTLARELLARGWAPVLPTDAEATGVSGGYAVIHRATSITAAEQTERFWLVGSIAFLNADKTVALYIELLSGKVEQRLTLAATLAGVRAFPLGLRWLGGIVQEGAGRRTRIREIQTGMARDHRSLLPQNGWLQVPFFAPNGTLRMSEAKIKDVLAPSAPRTPRGGKTRLHVRSPRSGQWRAIGKRAVLGGPDGSLRIGPHVFTAQENNGYIYLTACGAVEPTYRLAAADYAAIIKGRGNACPKRDSETGG